MRFKLLSVFLVLVALSFSNGFAQSAGANLTIGFPMGEFKENVDRLGWGFSGHFLFLQQTERNPFSVGLNIGFINYGNESRREPYYNVPEVTIDVDRSNNIVNFHVLFQLALPTGAVRPYIEGLFGGSYLFTETTVKNNRSSEEIAGSTNFDDFAWSYGGGGGFLIRLSSNDDPEEEVSGIFLDLKARYLMGTEAEYLKEGSIILSDDKRSFTTNSSKSKTDLLTVHAGVVVQFNSLFNR